MPEDPNVPKKPTTDSKPAPSGGASIDLDSILLPKKPTPGKTVDSAQRINAGALLEQEQKATLTPPPSPGTPIPPKPASLVPKPAPKPEEPMIAPLQTYKGDIESLIQNTNTSTVSIAAAEAARRSQNSIAAEAAQTPFDWMGLLKRTGFVIGGLLFLAAASGLLYVAYDRFVATVAIPEAAPAPFIPVDRTSEFALPPGDVQRAALMGQLESARQNNDLSLGLIERLVAFLTIENEEGDTFAPLTFDALFPALAPNAPAELMRTLTGTYLLGIHTYDGSQAFLLFEVDSYESAFAAMLEWERTMRNDLLPFFNREPRPRIPEEGVATSSVGSVPQLIQTGFSDKILENRDARVVLNTSGDILLLWAPLTQNLFVVTTNEYTLREIISRMGL